MFPVVQLEDRSEDSYLYILPEPSDDFTNVVVDSKLFEHYYDMQCLLNTDESDAEVRTEE